MPRLVLDPNVLISALITRAAAPARLVLLWLNGAYDLIVSARLLDELERVLGRAKFARYATPEETTAYVSLFRDHALTVADPDVVDPVSRDPADDYLVALARAAGADALLSGDAHLAGLPATVCRVLTPRTAVELVEEIDEGHPPT
ncbi:MAG: putative toxin-antitoxin system toxin component, PIN family [Gaiellaceae bacterium]